MVTRAMGSERWGAAGEASLICPVAVRGLGAGDPRSKCFLQLSGYTVVQSDNGVLYSNEDRRAKMQINLSDKMLNERSQTQNSTLYDSMHTEFKNRQN